MHRGHAPRALLHALGVLLFGLANTAAAGENVAYYWRLGENDPAPSVGAPGPPTTADAVAAAPLARAGAPLYGAPAPVTYSRTSMRFDGVDDRYFSTSVPPLANHTLELWVNPATTTGDAVLAYVGLPGTNGTGLYRVGNTYRMRLGADGFVGSAPAVAGQWTHLALTLIDPPPADTGVATLRVNGAVAGSLEYSPAAPTTGMAIGASPVSPTTEPFDGRIDEVRYRIHVPIEAFDPGNIQYYTRHVWNLGDQDPGAANGAAGNAVTRDVYGLFDLARAGGASYIADNPTPYSTLSMAFDGSGDRYSTPVPATTATDNFVLEAWAKPLPVGPSGSIVAYNGNSGADGFGIVHDGANWRALLGGLDIFGSAPATPGTWSHLALVRTAGTTTLYVDGVARGTSSFVPNPATTGFMIGGNVLDQEYFGGRIDRVALRTFAQFERTQLGYYCDDPLIKRSQNSLVHFESGCDFPGGPSCPRGERTCRAALGIPACSATNCGFILQAADTQFPYAVREAEFNGRQGEELFLHLFDPAYPATYIPTVMACEGAGVLQYSSSAQTNFIDPTTYRITNLAALQSLTRTNANCKPFEQGPVVRLGQSDVNPRGHYLRYLPANREAGEDVMHLVVIEESMNVPGGRHPLHHYTIDLVNVAPEVTLAGAGVTTLEGAAAPFDDVAGTFTDPGGAVDQAYTGVVAWGDGQTDTVTTDSSNGDGPFSYLLAAGTTHVYAQSGSYPLTVSVSDKHDDAGTSPARAVTVENVAPVASAPLVGVDAPLSGTAATFDLDASFTDAAGALDAPFVAEVRWGDGTTSPAIVSGGPTPYAVTFDGPHTYATPGTYAITIAVTDKDGGTGVSPATQLVVPGPDALFANGFE